MDSFAKNDPNEQSKKSIKRSEVIKQLSELPNKMFHTFFYGIINKKMPEIQNYLKLRLYNDATSYNATSLCMKVDKI